jgi:hypothetical protein
MILGAETTVHPHHKNLTYRNQTNQRVVQHIKYLEQFAPTCEQNCCQQNISGRHVWQIALLR